MKAFLGLIAVAALCAACYAQEPTSFDVMGSPPENIWSLQAEALDFKTMDAAPAKLEPKPLWSAASEFINFATIGESPKPEVKSAARPVVLAYTTNNCIPCIVMDAEIKNARSLPFVIEKKQPPAWVTIVPTLHWCDCDGKWKKIEGWNGLARFIEVYEASMKPCAPKPQRRGKAIALPPVSTWQQVARTWGPHWYEGNGHQPTSRQHLRDEHGIPLADTADLSQRELDRLHGFMHARVELRLRARAAELVQIEKKDMAADGCGIRSRSAVLSSVRSLRKRSQGVWIGRYC